MPLLLLLLGALLLFAPRVFAEVRVGDLAPCFMLFDAPARPVALASLRGLVETGDDGDRVPVIGTVIERLLAPALHER